MTLTERAKHMYESQENRVVPPWDVLGGGTQLLWMERAADEELKEQQELSDE